MKRSELHETLVIVRGKKEGTFVYSAKSGPEISNPAENWLIFALWELIVKEGGLEWRRSEKQEIYIATKWGF